MRDRWKFLTQYANSPTHPERTSNLCARWLWYGRMVLWYLSGAWLIRWLVRSRLWFWQVTWHRLQTGFVGKFPPALLWRLPRARGVVLLPASREQRGCVFVVMKQQSATTDRPPALLCIRGKKLFWKALAASRLLFILGRLSKRGIPISKSLT